MSRPHPEPPASPAPPGEDPLEILSELVRHFRALEAELPQLHVGESRWLTDHDEPADLEQGVLIRYRDGGESGEARIWVSPRRVKLKAHREDDHGLSQLEDRFVVTVGEHLSCGGTQFASPRAFAVALVELMRRRLASLPITPPPATAAATASDEEISLLAGAAYEDTQAGG